MKWNEETDVLVYKSFINLLKDILQIPNLLIDERCEAIPYYYYILKDLLPKIPRNSSLKDVLEFFLDEYDKGAFLITNRATLDLAWGLGISTEDGPFIVCEEIPYDQDTFVFSWTGFMSTICTQIKLQHSEVLYTPKSTECPCDTCTGRGETTEDYERWNSRVYPEDENYCGCSNSW